MAINHVAVAALTDRTSFSTRRTRVRINWEDRRG